MKCVICHRKEGNDDKKGKPTCGKYVDGKWVEKGVISLRSTTHGPVCLTCIDQLVGDVMNMRRPWTKEDLKEWLA